MHPQLRDAILAVAGLLGLAVLAVRTGGVGLLLAPSAIVSGVVGAVVVEVLFLRYPSMLLVRWEQPGVAILVFVVVLVGGFLAAIVAPWLLAVPVWGLVVYLVLLGCVLAGAGNPVAVLARTNR
ncbi:hypothetical protein [Halovenus halobia]|uniref:hypothetical protein n=1 Tax=Halovenus halobia TaxID=3396622 RepID=UPI003F54721B